MLTDVQEMREVFAELAGTLGLHVEIRPQPGAPDIVWLDTGGHQVQVSLSRTSSATPTQVSRLLRAKHPVPSADALRVLIADRIPDAARQQLRSSGWGWLDLRGHLHLAGHGVFVDAAVPSVRDRPGRVDAFSGAAGLEIACSVLLHPDAQQGVREIARRLGRSPSTVSEVLRALRGRGLVRPDGRAELPDLFWETASAWRPSDVALADLPRSEPASVNTALRFGLDDVALPGWALTDTLAAAAYGAPVAARADHPPNFYVPTPEVSRRAVRLLGVPVDPTQRSATIRVAPVPMICRQRVRPSEVKVQLVGGERWPLAHPLFVALDLASDPGRGREALDGWRPPEPWRRVW